MSDLATLLAPVCNLSVRPDWRTHARPGDFAPVGVIVHHTAGRNDLGVIVNGRPDLPGPLANLYADRDAPYTITLVSGGRCNHAGAGAGLVLDEVRRDVAPRGDALARGLIDGPGGNGYFYGVEAENLGDGRQPWPAGQLTAIAACCAALCRHHGWSANRVIGHREWTRRKIDPRGFAMADLRAVVAARLAPAPAPTPLPPLDEEDDMFIVWRMTGEPSVPAFLVTGVGKVWISAADLAELRAKGVKEFRLSAAVVDAIRDASAA